MAEFNFDQNDFLQPPKPASSGSSNKGLKILVVLLALLAAGMGAVGVMKYKEFKATETVLQDEKEQLLNDLNELKINYDSLSAANTQLQSEVADAKSKVEQLIAELEKTKKVDAALIKKYRRQIYFLRKERDRLVQVVDSLKQANQVLALQKDSLNAQLTEATTYNEKLTQENQNLAQELQKAKVLTATNIVGEGVKIKKSGKVVVTRRARRAGQIRVCLTAVANPVVKAGPKTYYVQVVNPKGEVIGNRDVISVEGSDVITSASKEFNYEGQNTDICIFVVPQSKDDEIVKGEYLINVYYNNAKVGTANFQLK